MSDNKYKIGSIYKVEKPFKEFASLGSEKCNYVALFALSIWKERNSSQCMLEFENLDNRFKDYELSSDRFEELIADGSLKECKDTKSYLYKVYYKNLTTGEDLCDEVYTREKISDIDYFKNRICDHYHSTDASYISIVQDEFEIIRFELVEVIE